MAKSTIISTKGDIDRLKTSSLGKNYPKKIDFGLLIVWYTSDPQVNEWDARPLTALLHGVKFQILWLIGHSVLMQMFNMLLCEHAL